MRLPSSSAPLSVSQQARAASGLAIVTNPNPLQAKHAMQHYGIMKHCCNVPGRLGVRVCNERAADNFSHAIEQLAQILLPRAERQA